MLLYRTACRGADNVTESLEAVQVRVRGVVQGVGFRPSVFRLARDHALTGWVLNAENGVEIHLEGPELALDAFLRDLKTHPPPAAAIDSLDVEPATFEGFRDFTIRESTRVDEADGASVPGSLHLRGLPRASCSIQATRAPGIRTSTARIAAPVTRSSKVCRTTVRKRR